MRPIGTDGISLRPLIVPSAITENVNREGPPATLAELLADERLKRMLSN